MCIIYACNTFVRGCGIICKSAERPVKTTGTSAGPVESSIKVLEDQLGLLEHLLDREIIYKRDRGAFLISGISADVIESYIKVLETLDCSNIF